MAHETPADEIMTLLVSNIRKLLLKKQEDKEMITASEITAVGKLLSDSSVTLASVKRGDFGAIAQQAAEQFPFDSETGPTFQ